MSPMLLELLVVETPHVDVSGVVVDIIAGGGSANINPNHNSGSCRAFLKTDSNGHRLAS